METIVITTHALVREQQRGISNQILDCLIQFGKVSQDNRGGEVLSFDKRSKQRCISAMGLDVYRKLEGQFDVYALRGLGSEILICWPTAKKVAQSIKIITATLFNYKFAWRLF